MVFVCLRNMGPYYGSIRRFSQLFKRGGISYYKVPNNFIPRKIFCRQKICAISKSEMNKYRIKILLYMGCNQGATKAQGNVYGLCLVLFAMVLDKKYLLTECH